jgi:hypothetical protein
MEIRGLKSEAQRRTIRTKPGLEKSVSVFKGALVCAALWIAILTVIYLMWSAL